ILDKYFQDFMELFFSDAAAQIDWSKGYENLDKEFQKIVRDARIGKRLADKLVKVWLKSGDELVVYVHTEVQGAPEADFERRMYTYHYRIFDRYDGHVVSLAVLSDEGDKWCPTRFETKMWGCRLQFDFSTVKLNDFRLQGAWSQLEESKNPFAKVVMAHLKTQDTKKDHDERKRSKMVLARSLYSGGFTKQQIMDIYLFMDWVMRLPDELAEQFDLELQEFEKERKMTYVTTMERRGIKKGMEQGMQQGMQREAQKTLLRILRKRFGEVTPAIEKMVADAPVEQIEAWIDAALDADALQQVFPDV
ncbi:MAG: DUF4351 domain-containing protein, partial [Bacteroidia bacterium]|nr:DUF4351 domain-containing protein [Bacteroidia bacterium]